MFLRVILIVSLIVSSPVLACPYCVVHSLQMKWEPAGLAKTDRGIRVRIGQTSPPYDVADIYLSADTERFVKPADQREARQRPDARTLAENDCRKRVPYEHLDQRAAVALRPHLRVGHSANEEIGPCIGRDDFLWFGLSFYEGEGEDGVGGLGRFDPQSEKLEMRRPVWLRDKSVGPLVHDGGHLWFGVRQNYEKSGVSYGLVRYDWERDELHPLLGADAPCGLDINGLLLDGATLWVTTESALSKLDLATNRWEHFALQQDGSRFVPADCRRMYRRILADATGRLTDESCSLVCGGEIVDELARLDPVVTREYLFSITLDPTNFVQVQGIGTVARDFAELKRYAIDRVERPEFLRYAVNRFAAKRSKERAWREFALRWARQSGQIEHLRYSRGDADVFDFLVTVARGDDKRADDAVEMLPLIDSKRAIPLLIDLLGQLRNSAATFQQLMTYADALQALERAAHLRIEADGTRTRLAANSDTPEYADEEFGAFRRNARERESLGRIIDQWNAWAREQGIASPPR